MYRIIFFIPIIGLIIFAARGWLYKDLPYTFGVVYGLAAVNGIPIALILVKIADS